ncbi:MAG: FtsW/RodA/SpoVE family cell cycle protein [Thermaceae bacterium]|nr:FtsW/RodA/SpoVE family cell cycle protein [Thermaceae bacterium]
MDPILLLSQLLLFGLSALGVASSDSMPGAGAGHLGHHLIRILIALAITFAVSRIRPPWAARGAKIFFVIALLLCVVVLIIGYGPAGVRRWINLPGSFDLQPSEFMKLAVILYLAAFFHNKPTDYPILGPVIAVSLGAGLVIIEPDFDTGLTILLLAGFTLVMIGVPWRRLLAIGATAWLLVLSFSGLYLERFKYVRVRFDNWLAYHRGDFSNLDALYQISQGHKLMIKAGLFGQGVGAPMPHHLPEAHNDMVFASVIWAGGWLAGLMILLVFALILARGLQIASNTGGSSSVMAVGLTGYLVLQAALNIGVVIGFLPVSGSPLPMVSYGGSSMLVAGVAMGLLHALSREAALARRDEAQTLPEKVKT